MRYCVEHDHWYSGEVCEYCAGVEMKEKPLIVKEGNEGYA